MEAKIIARVYYNPSYQGCNNEPCYLIFLPKEGLFVTNHTKTFKVIDKPTFEITEDTIDSYAESRGFEKVSDELSDKCVVYYNGYDNCSDEIARWLSETNARIYNDMVYTFPSSNPLYSYYTLIKTIASQTGGCYKSNIKTSWDKVK